MIIIYASNSYSKCVNIVYKLVTQPFNLFSMYEIYPADRFRRKYEGAYFTYIFNTIIYILVTLMDQFVHKEQHQIKMKLN